MASNEALGMKSSISNAPSKVSMLTLIEMTREPVPVPYFYP